MRCFHWFKYKAFYVLGTQKELDKLGTLLGFSLFSKTRDYVFCSENYWWLVSSYYLSLNILNIPAHLLHFCRQKKIQKTIIKQHTTPHSWDENFQRLEKGLSLLMNSQPLTWSLIHSMMAEAASSFPDHADLK